MSSAPDLTLVCCVEHGRLETQTLLMVKSLRTFGGALSQLPLIAVVGRLGAPLGRRTVAELEALGVQLVYSGHKKNPAPWFNYANKVAAVEAANTLAKTETIAWIDSDILFAAQPDGLILSDDEDFAARCDPLLASVERGNPKNERYWRALCDVTSSDYDALIWIPQAGRADRILLFNSGVFVWRRATDFAQDYAAAFARLLDSRIAQTDGSFFAADQIILNGVVTSSKLRWRHMRYQDHHMVFPGLLTGAVAAPHVGQSSILHYSGSLSEPYRTVFLERLARESPRLAAWLATAEEPLPKHNFLSSNAARWLKTWRGLQWRLYARRVIRMTDPA
jgi:hypothetical protein